MKEYELTVLIHPDLESNLEPALDKIRSLIASSDGKIIKEDNWGKKRLAYKINSQDFAVYVHMQIELPPAGPLKVSNILNITDEVIRYLLVKVDIKAREALEEAKRQAEEATSDSDDSEKA